MNKRAIEMFVNNAQAIEDIKKEIPYLAAYAWLHNAALREGSDREARRITITLMRIIRKIEASGATVGCHGVPEIKYISIEHKGRTIMEIGIQEAQYDSIAFS